MKKSHPLRKVIGYTQDKATSLTLELLECGHAIMPRQDIYGATNALRRRCWKCTKQATLP